MSYNKDDRGLVQDTGIQDCRFSFLCAPVQEKKRSCRKGWFGRKCPLPEIENQDISCVYKPLYKLGLIWIAILRHLLFPVSCGSPVVHAKDKDGENCKVRASDLPLYAEESKVVKCANDCPKSLIEETICCLRQELEILVSQGKIVKAQLSDVISSSTVITQDTITFLRKEENSVPRYGAIAIGSTSGYILALRKGIFKRLLYTTAGGSAVAALCYPCEAKQIAGKAVVHAKRYFVIGYHLLNGDRVNYEKLNKDLCNELNQTDLANCLKKEGTKGASNSKSDNKSKCEGKSGKQDASKTPPPPKEPPPPPPKETPPPPPKEIPPPCNPPPPRCDPPPPPRCDPPPPPLCEPPPPPQCEPPPPCNPPPTTKCISPPCPPGFTLSANPVSSPEQPSENWCPIHGHFDG